MSKNEIIMPKELTAENGAKGIFIGQFSETFEMTCLCEPCEKNYNDLPCEVCNDTGTYLQTTIISWSNIKDIYKLAVKHFGREIK